MALDFLKRQDINKGVEQFKAKGGAVLLDVRTKDEYQAGHVPGSKNIDVGEIGKVTSEVRDKSTPIFVYCHSGARSNVAVTAMKGMGYLDVKSIGGISSYTGLIEKGA